MSNYIDIANGIQIFDGFWKPIDCDTQKHKMFVFGDNEERRSYGGQAIVRDCENTVGIRTKALPSAYPNSFWSDDNYDENCRKMDEDLETVRYYKDNGYTIVLSSGCYGTGYSELPERAPQTFAYLIKILNEFCGKRVYDDDGKFVR